MSHGAWLIISDNSPLFPCHSSGKEIVLTRLLHINFYIVFHAGGCHFLFRMSLLLHQCCWEVGGRGPPSLWTTELSESSFLSPPLPFHLFLSLSLPPPTSPNPHTLTGLQSAQRNTLLSPLPASGQNTSSISLNTNLLPSLQNSQSSPEGLGFSVTNVRRTSRLFLSSALSLPPLKPSSTELTTGVQREGKEKHWLKKKNRVLS